MGLAERLAEAAAAASSEALPGGGPGDGAMDEDVEFLPEEGGDDGDAGPSTEPQEASGDTDDAGLDGEEAPEGDLPQTRQGARDRPESLSRMVRNMAIKERELAEERQARRQDQAEVKRLQAELEEAHGRPASDDEDGLEVLTAHFMRRLGTRDPDDPRVLEAIRAVVMDGTSVLFDGSEHVPEYKARRERILRAKQERERFRSYDQRIRTMEAERLRAQQQAVESQFRTSIVQFLGANADRVPLLQAAAEAGSVDPAELILRTAVRGVRDGEFPDPRNERELADLFGVIAGNLEGHYRGLAERLAAKLPTQAGKPAPRIDVRRSAQGAPPSRAQAAGARKAPNTRGGGGRGSAGPSSQREDQDTGERLDLAARLARAERQARRHGN